MTADDVNTDIANWLALKDKGLKTDEPFRPSRQSYLSNPIEANEININVRDREDQIK